MAVAKGDIMKKGILFWDVDTQYDFMRPEGRLYVPGAEGIIDTVSEVRHFALDNGFSMLADMDWHKDGNPEISDTPDFLDTFPPHCMAGKPGSERVGYLGNLPIDIIPNQPVGETDLRKMTDKEQFHIVIRKETLDVFTNPNAASLISIMKPESIVVFGVALDLCVLQTVEGLLKIGNVKLYLVRDAVKSLGVKKDTEVLTGMKNNGVEIISATDLKKKFEPRISHITRKIK
jgi:nicotinamidase/pyrazinamidase